MTPMRLLHGDMVTRLIIVHSVSSLGRFLASAELLPQAMADEKPERGVGARKNNNAHRGRRSGGRHLKRPATGRRSVASQFEAALGGGGCSSEARRVLFKSLCSLPLLNSTYCRPPCLCSAIFSWKVCGFALVFPARPACQDRQCGAALNCGAIAFSVAADKTADAR